ncbi:flagellar filament capping protein FliD [Vagococcus sp. DIV0080]|uniref:Flagellar hook-associated protein 2 n=1 Tax=Candidatus Vagococcus giribetii TaxID=2230876 RepID=A0ABS3HT98_9ENTE|nr:flagellar filament capping protein FliD [Vagococcus sp. DIV0080]MBO0476944.1 flagellar filament capping protein FliD [Vagococcus sp. DIV0080]
MPIVTSDTGISSTLGSYSGITSHEIDKLIEAESTPLLRMNNQKSLLLEQQNAWKDVRLRLNTFSKNIETLQKNETWNSKVATSSKPDKVTISGTDKAAEDNYDITVDQLATSSKLVSGEIEKLDDKTIYDELGTSGQFEFESKKEDGEPITIEIDESDSLKDITNKINAESKDTGVKATIVNGHLVLSNVDTGESELSFTGSEDLLNDLGINTDSTTNTPQYTEGQNAKFTIDGIAVERPSNNVSDVIEGVTIHLHDTTEDAVRVGLVTDLEKPIEAINAFVEQYNSLMDFINEKSDIGDPSKKDNKPGPLAGDSTANRLQNSLKLAVTGLPDENPHTTFLYPAELGISVDKTGYLSIDEEKLRSALDEDAKNVQNFFYHTEKIVVDKKDELGNVMLDDEGNPIRETQTKEFGYTVKLNDLMNAYLKDEAGKKSIYTTKDESFEKSIKQLDERIDRFTEKLDKKRDYYVRTFSRLDQAMMQAEQQMSFLITQLDAFSTK